MTFMHVINRWRSEGEPQRTLEAWRYNDRALVVLTELEYVPVRPALVMCDLPISCPESVLSATGTACQIGHHLSDYHNDGCFAANYRYRKEKGTVAE